MKKYIYIYVYIYIWRNIYMYEENIYIYILAQFDGNLPLNHWIIEVVLTKFANDELISNPGEVSESPVIHFGMGVNNDKQKVIKWGLFFGPIVDVPSNIYVYMYTYYYILYSMNMIYNTYIYMPMHRTSIALSLHLWRLKSWNKGSDRLPAAGGSCYMLLWPGPITGLLRGNI